MLAAPCEQKDPKAAGFAFRGQNFIACTCSTLAAVFEPLLLRLLPVLLELLLLPDILAPFSMPLGIEAGITQQFSPASTLTICGSAHHALRIAGSNSISDCGPLGIIDSARCATWHAKKIFQLIIGTVSPSAPVCRYLRMELAISTNCTKVILQ